MGQIKKVKGATLMETMVATVLIVIVFMIASLLLNNVFTNSLKRNTDLVRNRINELRYLRLHKHLVLPYEEDLEYWNISVTKEVNKQTLIFDAEHKLTKKHLVKTYYEEQ